MTTQETDTATGRRQITMKISNVMRDIMNLTEYQVQVTIPVGFKFTGVVPWNMDIVAGEAFVTVVAPSWDEAVTRVKTFFNQT